jgi:hypothetical protein
MTKLEEIQAKREQLRADAAKAEEMQARRIADNITFERYLAAIPEA